MAEQGSTPISGLEELLMLQEQGDWLYIIDADGNSRKMQASILNWQLVDILCGGDAGLRRMIKRGKDLTGVYTPDELAAKVQAHDFSNLFIDDYYLLDITTSLGGSETVRIDVSDFNYFLNCGSSDVKIMTDWHIVFTLHDQFLTPASMNPSNTTEGGYMDCDLRTNVLPVYYNALDEALGGHILSHARWLTTTVNTSAASAAGSNYTGTASNSAWVETYMELLSAPMALGNMGSSSSFRDAGDACMQLAKFALCPEERVCDRGYQSGSRGTWWLCAVASSAYFAACSNTGRVAAYNASSSYGVRPYFLFG